MCIRDRLNNSALITVVALSKLNTFFWIQRANQYVEKFYLALGNFLKASEKILKIINGWGAYTKEATEGPACNIQDNFYRRFSLIPKAINSLAVTSFFRPTLKTLLLIIMQKCVCLN